MKQLVFIHGRAQENKDAQALKDEWIEAWRSGLRKSGLDLPLDVSLIRFPYYGDTLAQLADGLTDSQAADVVVKGLGATDQNLDTEQREFIRKVLLEVQKLRGASDEQLAQSAGADVLEKGPLNWEWFQAILKAIDQHVPFASGVSIALATRDVYQYLDNVGIRDTIETGVRQALPADSTSVIVAHSLGTVVTYNLLRREGTAQRWNVPLLVTLGSPLAVTAIRGKLKPLKHPECVQHWYNAMDERDVVALYPLDSNHFPIDPNIENKTDIENFTTNRHGIAGYLSDAVVARRIYDALMP